MKTPRISDHTHRKLTALLGQLTAQKMKKQTYPGTIRSLLGQNVIVPPELLANVEEFINENKPLGYATKEEFLGDAARWRLKSLSGEYECVEVRKDVYEKLEYAIKKMDIPFLGASDFIGEQIKNALEKYDEWKEQTKRKRTKLAHASQSKKQIKVTRGQA